MDARLCAALGFGLDPAAQSPPRDIGDVSVSRVVDDNKPIGDCGQYRGSVVVH